MSDTTPYRPEGRRKSDELLTPEKRDTRIPMEQDMAERAPENPPAFPVAEVRAVDDGSIGISEGHPGMTLRDWFAGQTVAGRAVDAQELPRDLTAEFIAEVAATAYALADAMLTARQNGGAA